MKIGIALGLLGCLLGSTQGAHAQWGNGQPQKRDVAAQTLTVPMDVVFCVDGSGSMEVYLDQTKELIRALAGGLASQRGGIKTDLRVGLIQYGNDDQDYRILPMTRDLNALLRTVEKMQADVGASEWVGRVVQLAQQKMAWRGGDTFRAIYVMGNETAAQGLVSYRQSVPQAVASGIAVNAIQCELVDINITASRPVNNRDLNPYVATWLELADLGRGDYFHFNFQEKDVLNITQQAAYSRQTEEERRSELKNLHIDQWIDARMSVGLRLLQQTSLPNGAQDSMARQGYKKMLAVNAALGGTHPFTRNVSLQQSLGQALSGQINRDLVGRSMAPGFDIRAVPDQALPFEMRLLNLPERQGYLRNIAAQRQQIMAQLAGLQNQRLLLKRQPT